MGEGEGGRMTEQSDQIKAPDHSIASLSGLSLSPLVTCAGGLIETLSRGGEGQPTLSGGRAMWADRWVCQSIPLGVIWTAVSGFTE